MRTFLEGSAIRAGQEIVAIARNGPRTTIKADGSPSTDADERAEELILADLAEAYPDIPVVAEEAASSGATVEAADRFFLVDPLDGTKEFLGHRDGYTVNIALVRQGVPIAGVVYAPAFKTGYSAVDGVAEKFLTDDDGAITQRFKIGVRAAPQSPVVLASIAHCTAETEDFIRDCGFQERRSIGSSLKFCLLAEGMADVYPRFGRTMEWDTAAGDAVLRAAGGCVHTLDGHLLTYGKRGQATDVDYANPHFIACGSHQDRYFREKLQASTAP
ncbi:3'(2'),5'-bisphosphate nucleotidase [Xaviernesmea oryzae]|uniref:3'(2'),5'-bisphosphate nucleotidase CysQ n=1 Tax=Xaviernesmea oryzae TaxID=464029 RepID=A0A1Q9AUT0_9HYPH|nr:3'(2'),5'-bisphosphate nucleotidase CysQ [Xaviernesmea oryzae]OLP59211.1 3'(2'),5'-bisphosphate nucleotidase [Xaviernesmea oryzae]SEK81587.1 3'(2'), 5'-bisphosphate nucleotidase [Xaviernesmea oryzae]